MAFMAGYYIFFRCWPGFTEPFPFERFNGLSEEELGPALESFAREQLQSAEVWERIKQIGKRRRRDFNSAVKKQSSRRLGGGPVSRPERKPQASGRLMRWRYVRHADRTDPLVCRLGAYLGWWRPETFDRANPVGARTWFCETPSREFAEQVVVELNALNPRSTLDYDTHQVEYQFNPRFGFLSAEGLSDGEQASIRWCVNAIQEGREPAVRDGKLALFIGRRAVQVAMKLDVAWQSAEACSAKKEAILAAAPAVALHPEGVPDGRGKKRSTVKGEARDKIIAALTLHHKYQDGGCLNLEPIGVRELARKAGPVESTVSAFFKKHFKGHGAYKVVSRNAGRLAESLKVLNNEFSPMDLYGRNPPGEGHRDEED